MSPAKNVAGKGVTELLALTCTWRVHGEEESYTKMKSGTEISCLRDIKRHAVWTAGLAI